MNSGPKLFSNPRNFGGASSTSPQLLFTVKNAEIAKMKTRLYSKESFFYVFFAFFAVNNLQYTKTSTAASCADFTTSSNFRSAVIGSFSLAETAGTDSRKLNRKLLFTA